MRQFSILNCFLPVIIWSSIPSQKIMLQTRKYFSLDLLDSCHFSPEFLNVSLNSTSNVHSFQNKCCTGSWWIWNLMKRFDNIRLYVVLTKSVFARVEWSKKSKVSHKVCRSLNRSVFSLWPGGVGPIRPQSVGFFFWHLAFGFTYFPF